MLNVFFLLLQHVYYTIHITPQVECSWVSLETNLEMKYCIPLIWKTLELFQPGKAAISLMINEVSCYYPSKRGYYSYIVLFSDYYKLYL